MEWSDEALEAFDIAVCASISAGNNHTDTVRAGLDAAANAQGIADIIQHRHKILAENSRLLNAFITARAEAFEEAAKALECEGSFSIARYEAQDIIRALAQEQK